MLGPDDAVPPSPVAGEPAGMIADGAVPVGEPFPGVPGPPPPGVVDVVDAVVVVVVGGAV